MYHTHFNMVAKKKSCTLSWGYVFIYFKEILGISNTKHFGNMGLFPIFHSLWEGI